jgi:SAM-dependent methyltransferase
LEERKEGKVELKRKKFQGVLNILSFNRHYYVIGLAILTLVIVSHFTLSFTGLLFWIILSGILYGLSIPLIVSFYIYDFSGYYELNWLSGSNIDLNVKHIVNINAGFDETSFILKKKFPESDLFVFDCYDPDRHTEPAIIRARKFSLTYPNTIEIKTNEIPLANNSVDIIFLLAAAHEIRDQKEKVIFLKECHRICKANGKVVMVEHLRDLPNFLAFSVGFTHFFSKSTWENAFTEAGFGLIVENKFTPFMSVFNFSPSLIENHK